MMAVGTPEGTKDKLRGVTGRSADKTTPGDKRGRVLLVDDDRNILDVVASMLDLLDVDVDSFSDCHEAITHFIQSDHSYDVVVLDMMMADMTGRELLDVLREYVPPQPAIFCSGYGEETTMASESQPRLTAFLQKPFSIGELQAIVARFLPV